MFNIIKNIFFGKEIYTNASKSSVEEDTPKTWEESKGILRRIVKAMNEPEDIKREVFHRALGSQGISSKKLEGNNIASSLHSILEDINSLIEKHPGSREFLKAKPLFEQAYDLALGLFVAKQNPDLYQKKYIDSVKEKLNNLDKGGDKLLIPISFQRHAVLTEVTAEEVEGKITWNFKVYNAGLGSDIYHIQKGPLGFINPWARSQTYEIQGIDPDKIQSDDFFLKLFFEESEKTVRYSPKSWLLSITDKLQLTLPVYRHLKLSLIRDAGGEFVKHKAESKATSYHKPQNVGICATKCYTLWMRENLSEIGYKRFKVETAKVAKEKLEKLKKDHWFEEVEPKKSITVISQLFHSVNFLRKPWYRIRTIDDTDSLLYFTSLALKRREEKLAQLSSQREKFERLFSNSLQQ